MVGQGFPFLPATSTVQLRPQLQVASFATWLVELKAFDPKKTVCVRRAHSCAFAISPPHDKFLAAVALDISWRPSQTAASAGTLALSVSCRTQGAGIASLCSCLKPNMPVFLRSALGKAPFQRLNSHHRRVLLAAGFGRAASHAPGRLKNAKARHRLPSLEAIRWGTGGAGTSWLERTALCLLHRLSPGRQRLCQPPAHKAMRCYEVFRA